MKKLFLCAAASLALAGTAHAQTFTVSGSSLRDANGNDFVMRGVNLPLAWFQTDVYSNLAAIHTNSGSNTVRLVWTTTAGADSVLQNAIQRVIDNKMIPMVELHDATGSNDAAALNNMAKWYAARASYFKQANIAKYVLINIANEWSDWYMANAGGPEITAWRDAYKTAVTTIRNAGITSTLVIDGAAYGQDIRVGMLAYGQELLNADPRKNLLFSVHMYCDWTSTSKIESDLQAMKSANLPITIGEFGNNHPPCGDIPYKDLMRIAQSKGIGYLAWSWKGNTAGTLDQLDLSSNWSGTTLKTWGNDVINGTNGIRATAKVASVFSGSTSSAASSASSKASSSAASSAAASSKTSSSTSSKASSSAASSSASGTPTLSGTSDFPTGFSKCAELGATCNVTKGSGWVAFGRKGKWVAKNVGVGKSIACTVAAFGSDPGGAPNKCSTQN